MTRRNIAVGIATAGLALALALVVGPRLPLSCGTMSDRDPAVLFVLTSSNHDCSYTVHVGQSFAVEVPSKDIRCGGVDLCWSPVAQSERVLFQEIGVGGFGPGRHTDAVEIHFTAKVAGSTKLNPYRITINIED
jgi:hypothetical protein